MSDKKHEIPRIQPPESSDGERILTDESIRLLEDVSTLHEIPQEPGVLYMLPSATPKDSPETADYSHGLVIGSGFRHAYN